MSLPLPWFLGAIAVRTAIVLVALVAAMRLFGKRNVGATNVLDLLMVLLIGNAVQNALTQGSGELGVGLVSAAVLLVLERLQGLWFVRHPSVERRLFGEPTLLINNGRLDRQAMRREGVQEDVVYAALHDQGLRDLSEVRLALLEPDGSISVVPREPGGRTEQRAPDDA